MALSFGRKKGEATNEAENTKISNAPARVAGSGATEEAIDESWFDTLAEEAAANPLPATPAAAAPNFSVPNSAPQPDFSVFSTEEETDDFDDFGTNVEIPTHPTAAVTDSGVFVDPSASNPPAVASSTPFDTPPSVAVPEPAKKGGGLKKALPILLVLLIVGGGGAFWMSQNQSNEEDNGVATTAVAPPSITQPTGAAPTGASAPGVAPTTAQPATAPPAGQADPKVKAQLKKLWDEGLALRKQNKIPATKAKWGAAVRLARSKPGYEKSADMIQQAIDKLK